MKITILGCGSSGGVPLITNDWGLCNPTNAYNERRRASILVQHQGATILIDTSPDLRLQLLDAKISHIDAVIFTHGHADHIYGLHELRYLLKEQGKTIPVYADQVTMDTLKQSFHYAFEAETSLYKPFIEPHVFGGDEFYINDIGIIPFPQDHTTIKSLGFRIGNFAYSTDFKTIPESSLEVLKDLDLWIIDCLRFEEHYTHSHFDATQNLIRKVNPKRAILTHMNHLMDYDVVLSKCDTGTEPAFDGMIIQT